MRRYYKLRRYCKLRQLLRIATILLQIATVITNSDVITSSIRVSHYNPYVRQMTFDPLPDYRTMETIAYCPKNNMNNRNNSSEGAGQSTTPKKVPHPKKVPRRK